MEKASDAAAGTAVKAAGQLLELVKKKFHGKEEAEKSLETFTKTPSDSDAVASVQDHLKTQLADDPGFASELSGLLTQIVNTHADLAFVNNIGNVEKLVQFGTVHGDVSF
ncbi:hypothetical protein BMF89_00205 [Arthrobacter sp. SRS-W-1-2016]|uniref:hypothetical protein n=1 Tax=Arthrobacter sp. SRS-W-1-2016 TaxID=1930254 RepID=UPI000990A8F9|nr:hypothetical protein [Arthrobacter sp. SRS-W-1-2016]OOP65307.1 hypothetical protein BMF89_00205 [Arthrobacter sp. SRS-W-1-2016]